MSFTIRIMPDPDVPQEVRAKAGHYKGHDVKDHTITCPAGSPDAAREWVKARYWNYIFTLVIVQGLSGDNLFTGGEAWTRW